VSAAVKLAFQLGRSGFTEKLAARVASASLPAQDEAGSQDKNGEKA
jgi:glycerol-3-phosphate acyltransferase PlsX